MTPLPPLLLLMPFLKAWMEHFLRAGFGIENALPPDTRTQFNSSILCLRLENRKVIVVVLLRCESISYTIFSNPRSGIYPTITRYDTPSEVLRQQNHPVLVLYYGFRYYVPETGRWLSRDPIGEVDGPNVYTYVVQNPWTFFDPLGLSYGMNAEGDILVFSGDPTDPFNPPVAVISKDNINYSAARREYYAQGHVVDAGEPADSALIMGGVAGLYTLAAQHLIPAAAELLNKMAEADNSDPGGPSGKDISDENTGTNEKIERPSGVPENWEERPSKKDEGKQWVNPENEHDRVRSMPAKPDSPNPGQRKPYTERQKDGKWYDAQGNEVERKSEESHIPTDEYEHFDPDTKKDSSS